MELEQLVSLDCTPLGLRGVCQALLAQASQVSLAYTLPPPRTLGDLDFKPLKVKDTLSLLAG